MTKIISALFFIMTAFICYGQKGNDREILQIKAEIIGIGTAKDCDISKDYNSFFTRISLINNVDSVVSVWIMTCGWDASWLIDNENLSFCHWGCDRNYPEEIKLNPKTTITFNCVISLKNKDIKTEKFKLGFIMYRENDFFDIVTNDQWDKYIKSKKIYWSDYIELLYYNNVYRKEK